MSKRHRLPVLFCGAAAGLLFLSVGADRASAAIVVPSSCGSNSVPYECDIGWFPAGTTVRAGTCNTGGDLPGASLLFGDTMVQIKDTSGAVLAGSSS